MSSQQQQNDDLAAINQRFVAPGVTLPAVTLPDGTKLQTGTVGALIANIKIYDRIYAGEVVEESLSKIELERMLAAAIGTLARVGMFDIFPPDDWINGSKSEGRRYVGAKAKEMGH